MGLKRRKFQGVLNILSFNRHFYFIGLLVWVSLLFILFYVGSSAIWLLTISLAFAYGLIIPLIASAYIYDFSGYYNFNWLKSIRSEDQSELKIVNINAGFDETSFILKQHFQNADLQVFDFYDPKDHTEPAIVRARKVSDVYPNTKEIKTNEIPLNDKSSDLVFVLSAAHEIRTHKDRVTFLKECHRVSKFNGKVILVEHLRDLPNFLVFSVGFTHFFSRASWMKAFKESGFNSIKERKFTPFMSIFICQN